MRLNRQTVLAFATAILLTVSALAQGGSTVAQERTKNLRPPKGAKVAIIVFEDLQCPDCARAAPLLKDVSETQKVPLVRHDFPLPIHNYSYDAAIIARYFDTKSTKLGDGWREYVFQNQSALNPNNLMLAASNYAKVNGTSMPFLLDPGKRLEGLIKADLALGKKIGIQHTPTIFVVSNTTKGEPFVEVVDRSQLSQMIQDIKKTAK